MMRLELATKAYQGARSQQQDAAAALSIDDRKAAVLILADGLGGHESGAEAAQIVVEAFRKAAETGEFTQPARRRQALRTALEAANSRIAGGVDPAHGHRGMASTAVVAVVAEGLLNWISVGDSHLYIWRHGKLAKLNEDHSQAGLMVRSGQYKETDPEVQAVKSVLVSALTGRKLEIVDHPADAYRLESGDVLILASDGLNTISEEEIRAIVSDGTDMNAAALSAKLVGAVEDRKVDRQDNTTVAIARVIQAPLRPASEARTELRPPHPITAPTAVPSATQRTEVAPTAPAPQARTADAAETAVTQRIEPVGGLAQVRGAAAVTAALPGSAAPSQANVRTVAIPASELPTPKPPAPKPMPELKASKPMSPPAAAAKRNPMMGLLGVLMFVLAALLGAIALGKLAGYSVLDGVLGTSKTTAPQVEKAQPPKETAPPPAPAKATPPTPKQEQQPVQPPLPAPVQPALPAPQLQQPIQAVPPPQVPAPQVPPPQVLPPASVPAPAQPRPAQAPRPAPAPGPSSEPDAGSRAPEPGQAPRVAPTPAPGIAPDTVPARPQGTLLPQQPQRAPVPGQQLPVQQGAVPAPPVRGQSAPTGQPRAQAQQPAAVIERRGQCRDHRDFGQFDSLEHCRSECLQSNGVAAANYCGSVCRQLCAQ